MMAKSLSNELDAPFSDIHTGLAFYPYLMQALSSAAGFHGGSLLYLFWLLAVLQAFVVEDLRFWLTLAERRELSSALHGLVYRLVIGAGWDCGSHLLPAQRQDELGFASVHSRRFGTSGEQVASADQFAGHLDSPQA
jgi:hypothetical protein